jgi:hypothetical protein
MTEIGVGTCGGCDEIRALHANPHGPIARCADCLERMRFCRPSQVQMWNAALPFIGTFNRAETELAAAGIVLACTAEGDEWHPVEAKAIGSAMLEAVQKDSHWRTLNRNPFCPAPDAHALVEGGWARWTGAPLKGPIVFTKRGYDRLIEKGWMKEQT